MNNKDTLLLLDECSADLHKVKAMVDLWGPASNIVPYLNRYAIIKACGTIEVAYKAIVADFCNWHSKPQIKIYINNKVRDGSMNPSYSAMCKLLSEFDQNWNNEFKTRINNHPDKDQLLLSLKSLVDARNDFAHGGNPGMTILDVVNHFNFCRIIVEIMDDIVK